jgi:hypothetical protein
VNLKRRALMLIPRFPVIDHRISRADPSNFSDRALKIKA